MTTMQQRSARFRPGWGPTAAVAVVVALTVMLGGWQLGRGETKQRIAQQVAQRALEAPVQLGAPGLTLADVEHRRVTARGAFVEGSTIYLDNRTRQGVVGFEVLTALQTAPGRAVVVDRGWVAADRANLRQVPEVPLPKSDVEIEGLAVADPGHFAALPGAGAPVGELRLGRLWPNFSFDAYARATQLVLQPFVVLQTSPADDGLLRAWTPAGSGAQKHWSYAVQWFAMAVAAAVWWLWFGIARGRSTPVREVPAKDGSP